MKFKNCLTGILLLAMQVKGQEIRPLTIGDSVPDILIKGIQNYPALQSNLSAFKGKLLIINFIATTCSSCLTVLPAFSALQKTYEGRIQLLLLTPEKMQKVKSFLQRRPELKLPIAGEDTILSKLFPHTFISHEVWIQDGVVKAITHKDYVSAQNIETVLAHKKIHWPVKRDLKNFDYSQALLHINEENLAEESYPQALYYSAVTGRIANVPPKISVKDSLGRQRISAINLSIIDLYLRSYNVKWYPRSHIVLEVKDTSRYINYKKQYKDDWQEKNTFCYEAVAASGDRAREKMRSDLDYYLGLHGRIEKRKLPCFVLKKSLPVNSGFKGGREITLMALLYALNESYNSKPFLNETGLPPVTIVMVNEDYLTNRPLLETMLASSGYELTTEERETEVLILSEIKL